MPRTVFHKQLFFISFIGVSLLLSGCASTPPSPPPGDIRFTDKPEIRLNVASVEVEQSFRPSRNAHSVTNLRVSPAQALRNWVEDRLHASGSKNTLKVEIRDASVTSRALPREGGFAANFKVQQAEEVKARLEVTLRLYTGDTMASATVDAMATQSSTIPENASVLKREEIFHALVTDLMEKMDAELERGIGQYMAPYTQ
ncbi:MAG: hypothetical protein J0L97_02310 [Alphaproteobacteria bacterium]|nr:hypothetical protein [Alphaproteobacteria bacterium]